MILYCSNLKPVIWAVNLKQKRVFMDSKYFSWKTASTWSFVSMFLFRGKQRILMHLVCLLKLWVALPAEVN